MTRGNARELAVHLIYGRAFTGEEPEQVISTRMEKEYYAQLAEENDVYSDRPSRAQLRYIDTVVTGVANREEELDEQIQKYSIGWDISRISKLACGWRFMRFSMLTPSPPESLFRKLSALPRNTMTMIRALL